MKNFTEYMVESRLDSKEAKKLSQITNMVEQMISSDENADVAKKFFEQVIKEWDKIKKEIK